MQNPDIPNAFRTKTNALSIEEQRIFQLLQGITENSPLAVFPKPQLSTFITMDPNLAPEIQEDLEVQLKQMSCDFMLVNKTTYSPMVALSFNAPIGLQKLLGDLNISLIILQSQQNYDAQKLKTLLVHYL